MAASLCELRELRQNLRWSQHEMAKHLGVAQSTVSRMEKGQNPTGPVAKLIERLHARFARRAA